MSATDGLTFLGLYVVYCHSLTIIIKTIKINLCFLNVVLYRSFSGGLPVVEPAWILDCVAANRILSCKLFPLSLVYLHRTCLPLRVPFNSLSVSMYNVEWCEYICVCRQGFLTN